MGEKQQHEHSDFGDKIKNIIQNGYTTVGIAIGVHLGLFKLLAAFAEPKTSQEIADAGDFKERYVREWLGGMVCSGVIEVLDGTPEKFFLSKDRVPHLTGTSDTCFLLMAPLLISAIKPYEALLRCFKLDGPKGLPPDSYGVINEGADIDSSREQFTKKWVEDHLLENVIQKVPGLHEKLEKGLNVIDVGCGTGGASFFLAKTFPKSNFTGVDIVRTSIEYATRIANDTEMNNIQFVCSDVSNMPQEWSNFYDYVFIRNVVHDLPHPNKGLSEVYRILKLSGTATIIDIYSHETVTQNKELKDSSTLYISSLLECMPISLSYEGGLGVGAMAGNKTLQTKMEKVGLIVKSVSDLSDGLHSLFICHKG